MPCRDYESDNWDYSSENRQLKKQADKLARIACKAMNALEENGIEDFLLLKDDEVAEWWAQHKEADRKERARIAEQERRERVRAEALARLSDEEKELLGLQRPKVVVNKKGTKKHAKSATTTELYDIEQYYGKEIPEITKKLNEIIEDWSQEEVDIKQYEKRVRWEGE